MMPEPDGWKQHLITSTPTEAGETGLVFLQPHAIELKDVNAEPDEGCVTPVAAGDVTAPPDAG